MNTLLLPTTTPPTCLELGLAGAADASASTPTAAKTGVHPRSIIHGCSQRSTLGSIAPASKPTKTLVAPLATDL